MLVSNFPLDSYSPPVRRSRTWFSSAPPVVFWNVLHPWKVRPPPVKDSMEEPPRAQEKFLMGVLQRNANTRYLSMYGTDNVKCIDDFQACHYNLTTYEDYQPFVERALYGRQNEMTPESPDAFIRTSGTTGPSKYFPQRDHKGTLARWLDVIFANLHELCPQLGLLQKIMFHYVQPVMSKARCGVSIRPGISLYEDGFMENCFTTPVAGYRIQSFKEANYVHLLFALIDPNLGVFWAVFIGAVESMMKLLEHRWVDIVYDIEHGTIHKDLNFHDPDIRPSLEAALGEGHPERAGDLRREFQKGFDGIMKRLWPNLQVVVGVDSAGVWSTLKTNYAKGLQLVIFSYGTSEGLSQGLTPWFYDKNRSIAFWINNSFFEFIRLEDSASKNPQTLLIDQLEVGQEYELVFTTDSGLYRYRVGDVVRITGFHYNCPTFEFMYRICLMLNLRYEKMNQAVLKTSLQSVIGRLNGVRLVEYAVAESTLIPKSSPAFEEDEEMPYYVIFLEIATNRKRDESKETEVERVTANMITNLIDLELRDGNSDYQRLRREGAISQPRVYILKPDTFEDLKQHVLNTTSTTANQYKVPQRLRTTDQLNFMYDHAQ